MPPTTHIPTLEFRSLLLPPVRIPVRALRTLHRPQCAVPNPRCAPPQCSAQRRALNLYKTARSKTLLGQHKALAFSPYNLEPPSASQHCINLFEANKQHTDHKLIAKDVSLQDVYDNFAKDGNMLYNMQALEKDMAKMFMNTEEDKLPASYKNYSIVHAHTHRVSLNSPQKGRHLGALKNIIFTDSSPVAYYRISMDRAYQFIEGGSSVEFRIRLQGKVHKEFKHQPGDPAIWPWMHARFPHLRPDFILKAMPEGTEFLIKPVSDGRICQWVMGKLTDHPMADLDARYHKMRRKVAVSISKGQQEMLPKAMRARLAESGNDQYSPNTGLPRAKARAKYAKGGDVTYGAEEKKYMAKDAEGAGFLVPDPEEARKAEEAKARKGERHHARRTEGEADQEQVKKPRGAAPWLGRGNVRPRGD